MIEHPTRRKKKRKGSSRKDDRPSFRNMPIVGKRGEKMPNGQRFVSMRVKFFGVLGVSAVAVVLLALVLIPLSLELFAYVYDRPERSAERMDNYVSDFADHVASEQIQSTDNAEIVKWTRLHRLIYITVLTAEAESPEGDGSWEGNGSPTYEPFFDRLIPESDSGANTSDATLYSVRFANGNCSVAVVDNSYPILCDIIVLIGVTITVVAFCFIVLVYYHRQTGAIVALAREVEAVSADTSGDKTLGTALSPARNDEIGMLARDVDVMRRTIVEKMEEQERAWQANRDLLTSMTHDLRTPLTTLLGYMELLGSDRTGVNDNLTEEQKAYIRVCAGKAEQIKVLSDRLFLYFWAYNRPDGDTHTEIYDAELLFSQLIGDYIPAMAVAGLTVEADLSGIPAEATIRIDPECLHRVTDNLFDNLAKYADPTEPVRICVTCQKGTPEGCLTLRMENAIAAPAAHRSGTHIGHKTCQNMMTRLRGTFSTETKGDRFAAEITLPIEWADR